jgi:cysteine desulfurase
MDKPALVYLDYNATAPLLEEVKRALWTMWDAPLNASSIHGYGREAKRYLEEARADVATLVGKATSGCNGAQVIFTSSGTEANNLALRGVKNITRFVSAVEHPSVLKTVQRMQEDFRVIPVDAQGVVDLNTFEKMLRQQRGKALVSVMLANNETGVIQPMTEIVALCRQFGVLVHTDAVQAVGRMPVNMRELGVDMMTISSHKLGGLPGAAALIIRKDLALQPQIIGGGQELGFRAGTENIPAIYAFGLAAKHAKKALADAPRIAQLRDTMETLLRQHVPDVVIAGAGASRLPNTSCVLLPGVKNETQLIHFDMHQIAVSAGSACSSGKVEVSHVLRAMGYDDEKASEAIRVSLGAETTESDIARFVKLWGELYQRSGRKAA